MDPHRLLAILLLAVPALAQTTLSVDDFGAAGDGRTDDAPAIQRAIAAAVGKRATITFTAGRTYRLLSPHPGTSATAGRAGMSVLSLEGADGLTIDGQGAKLLLHPDVQFCFARECTNLAIRGFEVDMDPLPFVPGTVEAVDAAGHSLDVRIADGFDVPAADGSEMPAHPPFFGWLVPTGADGNLGHYFVQRLTATADPRTVRLQAREQSFRQFEGRGIVVGTKVSVPVPGLAHVDRRFMQIDRCENVTIAELRIWSLPYFAFNFWNNTGRVRVSDVVIAPKPDTPRLTSAGRDGFHCKDNRAEMIFERCRLAGLRDDCFNISAMTAVVHERVSETELLVKRTWYPNLDYAVFAPGDRVQLYDEQNKTIYWANPVATAEDLPGGPPKLTRLTFSGAKRAGDAPSLPDTLRAPTLVLNQDAASPGAIIRQCDITGSCRMRARLLIDESTFTGFNWYYTEHVEGPFPWQVMIRNSHFINNDERNNRGECLRFALPTLRLGGSGGHDYHELLLQHNVFDGGVVMTGAKGVALIGNQFNVTRGFAGPVEFDAWCAGNTLGGEPWGASRATVADPAAESLLWPFACFMGRLPGDAENRHVAALGPEVVAKRGWRPRPPGNEPEYCYMFRPPPGGEVGVELDLGPQFRWLSFRAESDGNDRRPVPFIVYGCRRDGSRRVLPPAAHDGALRDQSEVDLTGAPAEFAGRRRINLVVPAGDEAMGTVRIWALQAWSQP